MKSVIEHCEQCGAELVIDSYRKFSVCPYCGSKNEFKGFDYVIPDPSDSKYAHVKYEQDCPVCRGKHMLLMGKYWRCIDCGYKLSKWKKPFSVFWFCDNCDAYMNVQKGFTTRDKIWTCSVCGFQNDVSKKNIG